VTIAPNAPLDATERTPIHDQLEVEFAGRQARAYIRANLRIVACGYCGATTEEPCRTSAGKVTRHKGRR